MPIFRLVDEPIFPPPDYADPSGLLAVGGDLSKERLLEAYRLGIFPWYSDDQPILWWSPDPRLVLDLKDFTISRSLRKTLKKAIFQVTFDHAFEQVIQACAVVPRAAQNGTWITEEMQEAYINLHGLGYAHSVESWLGGKLAGWALRCFPGQGFLRRIHVSFEDGCVQSRSRNSRREVKELGLSLHRLADDDGTYDQARRQRVAAANISQTITVSPASSDQAGTVATSKVEHSKSIQPFVACAA